MAKTIRRIAVVVIVIGTAVFVYTFINPSNSGTLKQLDVTAAGFALQMVGLAIYFLSRLLQRKS
jgi:hypothetical protein